MSDSEKVKQFAAKYKEDKGEKEGTKSSGWLAGILGLFSRKPIAPSEATPDDTGRSQKRITTGDATPIDEPFLVIPITCVLLGIPLLGVLVLWLDVQGVVNIPGL